MPAAFVLTALILTGVLCVRGLRRGELLLLIASLVAHLGAAALQYYLQEYYYGVSDAHSYLESGTLIARLLEVDFLRFAPEAVKAALHLDSMLPAPIFGEGASTGTMSVLAGGIVYAFGPSLLVACLVTSLLAWVGQCLCYRVARDRFAETDGRAVIVGTMLIPSVIFWGSGFNKEAFVVFGFGAIMFAIHRLTLAREWYVLPIGAGGALTIGLIKPYVLFPLILALSAYVYANARLHRRARRYELLYLVGACFAAVAGLALLSQLFPEFGVAKVAQTMAGQQDQWQYTEGGSNLELGDQTDRTLIQQLPYVPLAFVNALFRPFLFEARNGPMLGAAIEMTVLAVVLALIAAKGTRRLVKAVVTAPEVIFCLTFTCAFAVAVGLATSNLGSLSRYRVPMMPLYGTAVLVLMRRVGRARVTAIAQTRVDPVRRTNAPSDSMLRTHVL